MHTHIFQKIKLEKNEVLITSFEHCLKIYYMLKEDGYKDKDNDSIPFVEEQFLKDIREQLSNPSLYEYDTLYLMNGKVDIFVYKIDRLRKTFSLFCHRVG